MISLIFKSYFAILISVGISSILVFILGLYLIFRLSTRNVQSSNAMIAKIPIETDTHPQAPSIDSCFFNLSEKDFKASGNKPSITITSHDINAIAGDDVLATQLDLARAYIETGRKQLAKKILDHVVKQGNSSQQEEAKYLLNFT